MKGLVIKPKWADLILSGKKTWEIRGSKTKIRGTISIIKSGTGMIYGTVDLVDCKYVDALKYDLMRGKHMIPDGQGLFPHYENMYAWVMENPIILPEPIPYTHPQGAVIWVNLPDDILVTPSPTEQAS